MATAVIRACRRTIAKSSEPTDRILWSRTGAPDLKLTPHYPASLPRSSSCKGRIVCLSPTAATRPMPRITCPPAREPADTREEARTSVNSNRQLGGLFSVVNKRPGFFQRHGDDVQCVHPRGHPVGHGVVDQPVPGDALQPIEPGVDHPDSKATNATRGASVADVQSALVLDLDRALGNTCPKRSSNASCVGFTAFSSCMSS